MKSGVINIGKFTKQDAMKADRKASREISLMNSTGWTSVHKVHKSEKNYTRKSKHKVSYI